MGNELNLDELERLAKAATPGPWNRQDFYSSGSRMGVDGPDGQVICASFGAERPDDFDFIAASNPATVLELVRRLRAAEHDLQVTETQCLDGIQAQNELHEEIEQLRKDAERYRWLRHNSGFSIAERLFGEQSMSSFIDAELDALIDGELAQEAKSGD